MRRSRSFLLAPVLMTVAASISFAHADGQTSTWSSAPCGDNEGNTHNSFWGHQQRECEVRTTTLKLGGSNLSVKSENGGIEVTGEDRSNVAVEARVQAWSNSAEGAKEILRQVGIETTGDSIRDHGPHSHLGNSGYGINYRLSVPRKLAVELKSENGGIEIAHLEGEIHFDTTNGGVTLDDLAGNVRGETVNGGLTVSLSGDSWRGKGLDVQTTNGGVSLSIPSRYSAHLETETVNGGIRVDYPVTIQGKIKNRLSTDLGSGGPTIHAETTNGGVEINRERETD